MIYITGDIHGNDKDLKMRCQSNNLTENDILIIVGDVGANFYISPRDRGFKGRANKLGHTIFCVHGNHEARPYTIETYKEKEWHGGIVYYEEDFPNLLFAKDGEIYDFDGIKTFVCGGAYSVDKYYRAWKAGLWFGGMYTTDMANKIETLAANGTLSKEEKKKVDKYLENYSGNTLYWWRDEQPSKEIKKHCEAVLDALQWKIDVVLTHTSPEKFEPTEMFLNGLNQDNVDKTTEKWFDKIEKKLDYKKWYAGHYHTDKTVNDKFQFLYREVRPFTK